MTRIDPLALIDALGRAEGAMRGRELVAPLLGGRRGRVRVRAGGLVHELRVAGARPGWWLCRALDARRAEVIGEAQPWQRGDYLALLPALRLVLLAPAGRAGDWLALPYNHAEAARRFGFAGPAVLRLVEGGQPFERVVARVEGGTLLYDAPDRRADPTLAEALRAALAQARPEPGVPGLSAGEAAAYGLLAAEYAERTTDGRIRAALSLGGAQLIGYEAAGDEIRVTWERGGQRSVALVTASLDVVSAGICLSGEDGKFDLTSLVGVVAEAPDYAEL